VAEDARFLFAVTVAAAAFAYVGPIRAYDLWWHLKAGAMILESGVVPQTDPFSFTAAGRPWTYHSWLSGVILSLVWRSGGAPGIVIFRSLMLAAALGVSWIAARRRGVGAGAATVFVLTACLQMRVRALARPFLFSFVLFILFVVILQPTASRDRQGEAGARPGVAAFLWGRAGRLLLLPVLMLLWVNLHAGFAAGLLAIGAYGAGALVALAVRPNRPPCAAALLKGPEGARFRALLAAGVLSLIVCLATPNFTGTLLYPFRLTRQVLLLRRVQEWQPVPLSAPYTIFWAVLALGLVLMARSAVIGARTGRLRAEAGQFVTDALLLAGFAALSAQAVRHMAWVLLLAPPILGWHLDATRRGEGPPGQPPAARPLYAYAGLVLAVLLGAGPFLSSDAAHLQPSRYRVPIKACDFIEEHRLYLRPYNTYDWGGYLIWRHWPQMKVFVDGRCLLYGDRIIGQTLQIEDGAEGWPQVLRSHDVQMLIVNYRKRDCRHLFADDRWRCVYWDDIAVIALRDDLAAAPADGLRTFPLTNPALSPEQRQDADPEMVLAELDAVLARDPEVWTAWAFRAQTLVRAGRPDEALSAARRAVDLEAWHAEPWRAVRDAAQAAGRADLAAEGARKLARLAP